MTDYSGALVINSQTSPPQQKPKSKVSLIIIMISLLVLVITMVSGIYAFNNRRKILSLLPWQKTPKVIKSGTVDNLVRQTHPNIFQAELEYNSTTDIVTQITTTKINGDIPHFLENQPRAYPGDFAYKVEVVSDQNELIQTGWKSIPQEILIKRRDNIYLTITTIYQPKAIVRIYLPSGKLIWTGGIE